jgi:hypothetical protein
MAVITPCLERGVNSMTFYKTTYEIERYGFHFENDFVNNIKLKLFGFIPIPVVTHGRCGGMAFASLDYFHAGFPAPVHVGREDFPEAAEVPPDSSLLARYIFTRLMDSFALNAFRFLVLTQRGDGYVADKTRQQVPLLISALRNGPVPLGLIMGQYFWNLADNHQVVAYGADYDEASGALVIQIYDNNYPDIPVTLTYEPSSRTYRSSRPREDGSAVRYRGWFVESYQRVAPPYIDLAITNALIPSNSSPRLGDPLDCTYTIRNFGEFRCKTAKLDVFVKSPEGVAWKEWLPPDTSHMYLEPNTQYTYTGHCFFFADAPGTYLLQPSLWPGRGLDMTGLPETVMMGNKINFVPGRETPVEVQGLSNTIMAVPPYLERVEITQVTDGVGGPAMPCERARVVYEASWTYNSTINYRQLKCTSQVAVPMPHKTLVFKLTFSSPGEMRPDSVRLRVTGTTTEAFPIDETIPLTGSGCNFTGRWKPRLISSHDCDFQLHVEGADDFPRYPDRRPHGDIIDARPFTAARVDATSPGFPFINYEPGTDLNHVLTLTPKRDSLPADLLEPNDQLSTASRVLLSTPSLDGGAWARFDSLNLHNAADQDYFFLKWQSLQGDDAYTLEKPVTEIISDYMGISVTRYPPCLQISVLAEGMCSDLVLYRFVSGAAQLVSTLIKEASLLLYNPASHFPTHSLIAAVRNTDFPVQGAFPYRAEFGYMPATSILSINGSAPAYQPLPDLSRSLLDRYYSLIDLPRPADDLITKPVDASFPYLPSSLVITDWNKFMSGLEAFLLHPGTLADIECITPKQGQAVITDALAHLHGLAQAAPAYA